MTLYSPSSENFVSGRLSQGQLPCLLVTRFELFGSLPCYILMYIFLYPHRVPAVGLVHPQAQVDRTCGCNSQCNESFDRLYCHVKILSLAILQPNYLPVGKGSGEEELRRFDTLNIQRKPLLGSEGRSLRVNSETSLRKHSSGSFST